MTVLLVIAAFLFGIIVGAICKHIFGEPQHIHEWGKKLLMKSSALAEYMKNIL